MRKVRRVLNSSFGMHSCTRCFTCGNVGFGAAQVLHTLMHTASVNSRAELYSSRAAQARTQKFNRRDHGRGRY